jgi:hypothetical protein
MRDIDGILYVNDGDWVESCTAVLEHHDGQLEIVHWAKRAGALPVIRRRTDPQPVPQAA